MNASTFQIIQGSQLLSIFIYLDITMSIVKRWGPTPLFSQVLQDAVRQRIRPLDSKHKIFHYAFKGRLRIRPLDSKQKKEQQAL